MENKVNSVNFMIQMQDLPGKTLFRPDEVAAFFCVSRATIYRWIDCGLLAICKPCNGVIRIKRESILNLLNRN